MNGEELQSMIDTLDKSLAIFDLGVAIMETVTTLAEVISSSTDNEDLQDSMTILREASLLFIHAVIGDDKEGKQ